MSTTRPEILSTLKTRFEEEGYLVLRQVLAPETVERVHDFLASEMTPAIDRLRDQLQIDTTEALVDHINHVAESSELTTLDKPTRDIMTGHYPLGARLSPELWAIPRDEGLRQVLTCLLDSDTLRMHMPPAARFVLPMNAQAGVPAHQDTIYNEHMSDFITVWVPLVEIDERCGGVAVYPRSGHVKQDVARDNGKLWYDAALTDGLDKYHVHCTPGDILVMNNYVIHESMPNVSETARISVDLRFFGETGTSKKHYLDMQDWRVVEPSGS